jgi:uncharacterized protein
MQVNQDPNQAKYQIQSYNLSGEQKGFIINGILYQHSILIHNDELFDWRPSTFEDLNLEDFKPILEKPPSILLLGTGQNARIPSMNLLRPLFFKHIGVEFMTTAAAIRTYTVLSSENRNVSLGLIEN